MALFEHYCPCPATSRFPPTYVLPLLTCITAPTHLQSTSYWPCTSTICFFWHRHSTHAFGPFTHRWRLFFSGSLTFIFPPRFFPPQKNLAVIADLSRETIKKVQAQQSLRGLDQAVWFFPGDCKERIRKGDIGEKERKSAFDGEVFFSPALGYSSRVPCSLSARVNAVWGMAALSWRLLISARNRLCSKGVDSRHISTTPLHPNYVRVWYNDDSNNDRENFFRGYEGS